MLSDQLWLILKARGDGLIDLTMSACPYIAGMGVLSNGHPIGCTPDYNDQRRQLLLSLPPSVIVVHSLLPFYIDGPNFDNGEGGIQAGPNLTLASDAKDSAGLIEVADQVRATIAELIEHGHKVILVYPVPETGWNITQRVRLLVQHRRSVEQIIEDTSVNIRAVDARLAHATSLLNSIPDSASLLRVSPRNIICGRRDEGRCDTVSPGQILYADEIHLSQFGTALLAAEVVGTFDQDAKTASTLAGNDASK